MPSQMTTVSSGSSSTPTSTTTTTTIPAATSGGSSSSSSSGDAIKPISTNYVISLKVVDYLPLISSLMQALNANGTSVEELKIGKGYMIRDQPSTFESIVHDIALNFCTAAKRFSSIDTRSLGNCYMRITNGKLISFDYELYPITDVPPYVAMHSDMKCKDGAFLVLIRSCVWPFGDEDIMFNHLRLTGALQGWWIAKPGAVLGNKQCISNWISYDTWIRQTTTSTACNHTLYWTRCGPYAAHAMVPCYRVVDPRYDIYNPSRCLYEWIGHMVSDAKAPSRAIIRREMHDLHYRVYFSFLPDQEIRIQPFPRTKTGLHTRVRGSHLLIHGIVDRFDVEVDTRHTVSFLQSMMMHCEEDGRKWMVAFHSPPGSLYTPEGYQHKHAAYDTLAQYTSDDNVIDGIGCMREYTWLFNLPTVSSSTTSEPMSSTD
jgi:hypothetical protein